MQVVSRLSRTAQLIHALGNTSRVRGSGTGEDKHDGTRSLSHRGEAQAHASLSNPFIFRREEKIACCPNFDCVGHSLPPHRPARTESDSAEADQASRCVRQLRLGWLGGCKTFKSGLRVFFLVSTITWTSKRRGTISSCSNGARLRRYRRSRSRRFMAMITTRRARYQADQATVIHICYLNTAGMHVYRLYLKLLHLCFTLSREQTISV